MSTVPASRMKIAPSLMRRASSASIPVLKYAGAAMAAVLSCWIGAPWRRGALTRHGGRQEGSDRHLEQDGQVGELETLGVVDDAHRAGVDFRVEDDPGTRLRFQPRAKSRREIERVRKIRGAVRSHRP